jgi:hypothetical protein
LTLFSFSSFCKFPKAWPSEDFPGEAPAVVVVGVGAMVEMDTMRCGSVRFDTVDDNLMLYSSSLKIELPVGLFG